MRDLLTEYASGVDRTRVDVSGIYGSHTDTMMY